MKMKTKTINIAEIGVKITIEYPDAPEDQFTLPLMGKKMTLHDVELEVCERVIDKVSHFHLADLCRLQHIADARQVFCFVAKNKYGFAVAVIADYLKRSADTVKYSIKKVGASSEKRDSSLWSAYKRYEV